MLAFLLQRWRLSAVLAVLLLGKFLLSRARRKKLKQLQAGSSSGGGGFTLGTLDLRRKAQITYARATDHTGEAVLVPNLNFDLNQTIFASVQGGLKRAVLKQKLAVLPHWSDKAIESIEAAAARKLPSIQPMSSPVLNFMRDECNFICEHADGSFMDHLRFCHDYSALNFKGHSPRVLLLHSILGVATNIFPMALEKLPTLEGLITPVEMLHVSAFPSVQRTILNGTLFPAIGGKAASIQQVSMKRVIDNQVFTLDQEQFWVHLNYQLVHLMDFLPTVDWEDNLDDPQMAIFLQLRAFLIEEGRLMAAVDSDAVDSGLKGLLKQPVTAAKTWLYKKSINKYSADVGHDLTFDIQFASQ